MGGNLRVESEVDRGSTFSFILRLQRQKNSSRNYAPVADDALRGLNVLIVDDNSTNRRILREVTLGWHMQPTLSESGPEALRLIELGHNGGTRFSLVLLDAKMPGMDGFTVAEKISQGPSLGAPAIIMLTSTGLRGDVALSRAVGIKAYLTKPVARMDLLRAVKSALGSMPLPQPAPEPPAVAETHGVVGRLRILLVEDNQVNQLVATRLLQKNGHEVTVADNGRNALEILNDWNPDLIFMDVQMPEMDGYQATAAIRSRESGHATHVPIIAMTANAMAGDKERCLASGMDGYVSKPLGREALNTAIDLALSPAAHAASRDVA
jgi:CheY-like chemotaxis protein